MKRIKRDKLQTVKDDNRKANESRRESNASARAGYDKCNQIGDFFSYIGFFPEEVERMVLRYGKSKNEKWHKVFFYKTRPLNSEHTMYQDGIKEAKFTLESKKYNERYGEFDVRLVKHEGEKDEIWLLKSFLKEIGMSQAIFCRFSTMPINSLKNKFNTGKFTEEDKDYVHVAWTFIWERLLSYNDKMVGLGLLRDKDSKKRIESIIKGKRSGKESLKVLAKIEKERKEREKRLLWAGVEGYDDEGYPINQESKDENDDPEIQNPDFTLE